MFKNCGCQKIDKANGRSDTATINTGTQERERERERKNLIENLPEAYCEKSFPGILQRSQGKMAITLFILLSILVYGTSAVGIMPGLKQNV